MRSFILLATIIACSYAVSLNWQVGTEYIYNVVGTLDARGNVNGTRSKGSSGSMNATLVIQCLKNDYKHQSNSFFFVMNLFDTNVDVSQGMSAPLDSDDGLGDDMYFWQTSNGSIPETWYEDGDSPYFVNVKLGVINAFQTFIVDANQQLTIDETDPVGVHQANMVGASHPVGVQISKTFDENSFSSFADTTLTAKNIKLAAQTTTVVHNQGYVYSSVVNQVVTLTQITPSDSVYSSKKSKRDTSAVDVLLSSAGSLSISFQGTNTNNRYFSSATFNTSTLTKSNLLTTSRAMMAFMDVMSIDGEDQKSISQMIDTVLNSNTAPSYKLTRMIKKICTYLELNPVSMGLLLPKIKVLSESSAITTARLMLILSQINHTSAADMLISYGLKSPNASIAVTAILATHRAVFENKQVLKTLISLSTVSSEKLVRNVAQMAVKSWIQSHTSLSADMFPSHIATVGDSDFPYNRSWSGDASFGGKTVGVDFSASVFAGTNFDCAHTTFNYEAAAKGDVTATLFGHSANAVDAGLIYGRENGNALQDQIYVSIFGDMVYDQQLSKIDCIQHSADIAHTSPGFSVSYVVWISIIPVTFTASASLELDLSYFWNICPDQLTAELELLPSSTLTVGGSAEIDLLIIKAGVELDGNFEAQVPPKAEVDGSLCQVTFEVDLNSKPIEVNMDAYYAVKSCKYWIFDCHWKEQGQTTIFSWGEPEHDDVLFQQTWKISN